MRNSYEYHLLHPVKMGAILARLQDQAMTDYQLKVGAKLVTMKLAKRSGTARAVSARETLEV